MCVSVHHRSPSKIFFPCFAMCMRGKSWMFVWCGAVQRVSEAIYPFGAGPTPIQSFLIYCDYQLEWVGATQSYIPSPRIVMDTEFIS